MHYDQGSRINSGSFVVIFSRPYLRQAEEIENASLYVGDFKGRTLDLPEFGYPVQIIQLHSRLSLIQEQNQSYHCA